jgi:ABC-type uncharacterized transport system ATPase subunit
VLLVHQGRMVFDGPVEEMQGTTEEMENKFRELTTA